MVLRVEALMVGWFGIVRQSDPPSERGRRMAMCSASRTSSKPRAPKGSDDSGLRRIDRKLRHQAAMVASVMKASINGDYSENASLPKVSMWKRMADLIFASASS